MHRPASLCRLSRAGFPNRRSLGGARSLASGLASRFGRGLALGLALVCLLINGRKCWQISSARAAYIEDGGSLMERFQCQRCHEGTGLTAVPIEKHCVRCHQSILRGDFQIDAGTLRRWQGNLRSLPAVPSFVAIDRRLRRDWIAKYLQQPTDLRPGLLALMPRLRLGDKQAQRIATWLVPSEAPAALLPSTSEGLAEGRRLIETRGCGSCHRFSGVASLPALPPAAALTADQLRLGLLLAPDLRYTRERFQSARLVSWLRDPGALKPDTVMPKIPLSEAEAAAIAAYILYAPLAAVPPPAVPVRLPPLARRVTFAEVNEQVFRRTCWHCHSTPEYAMGDGGPGNTGGFGFAGRGLNLASYSDVLSGSLDDRGVRRSIFLPLPDGVPRIVAVLLARQRELAGEPVPGLRGMPLGLPALSSEQIQLVESWIAQGRPQ